MQHAEKTVTVYHREWDAAQGMDAHHGTILTGVSFFARIATAVSTDGLAAACEAVCRIPMEVCPDEFLLSNGDLIIEGEGPVKPNGVAEIPGHTYTVVGITRNTTGSAPHIKVVCK